MACFLPAPYPSPQIGRPGQKPGSDPNRSWVQTGQFPSPRLSPRIWTMPPLRVLKGGGDTWQCLGWATREAGDCCHFSGSQRAPLSLGPAHTFLRDPSDACRHACARARARAYTHTHTHTPSYPPDLLPDSREVDRTGHCPDFQPAHPTCQGAAAHLPLYK